MLLVIDYDASHALAIGEGLGHQASVLGAYVRESLDPPADAILEQGA
jgi:hypothetical protein